ncbi:MAG: hypothetical protein PUF65_11250 [Lachnospiraceae bacterium]|nr:hypothetical protein [Lachnospiraceae bacterium]
MIGYSIMMWFVTVILLVLAIALLRGNVASIHGKVFDETDDKAGYAKQLGKPCILISIGTFLSGVVAIFVKGDVAILCALAILLVLLAIAAAWFRKIQKRYTN